MDGEGGKLTMAPDCGLGESGRAKQSEAQSRRKPLQRCKIGVGGGGGEEG